MLSSDTNRVIVHMLLSAISVIGIVAFLWGAAHASPEKQEHVATLDGTTIRMQPSGASFRIPLDWTKDYQTVNVTRAQLKRVRKGRGEWYREYAYIVNA